MASLATVYDWKGGMAGLALRGSTTSTYGGEKSHCLHGRAQIQRENEVRDMSPAGAGCLQLQSASLMSSEPERLRDIMSCSRLLRRQRTTAWQMCHECCLTLDSIDLVG